MVFCFFYWVHAFARLAVGCLARFLVKGCRVSITSGVDSICKQLRMSADTILALAQQADVIQQAAVLLVQGLQRGAAILTAGNGGSAAEAMHMAEELTGRFRSNRVALPGIALNADGTLLTCIGNDFGFDAIFSRQIEGIGRADDILVLFSTSGQAENLRLALEAAQKKGMHVIGLLGRDGGSLAGMADVEIRVAGEATERIQEAQQVVMHIWLQAIEDVFVVT